MRRPLAHFLHIGKTGGTAVREALTGFDENNGIALHAHEFTLLDVPEGETAFFFLRDPVTRFVSAFNSRLRRGQPRWHTPWSEDEAWAFGYYKSANELAEDLGSDNSLRAMAGIGHVNTTYAKWLVSVDYVRSKDVIFIGRLERISEDFASLRQLLGVPDARLPIDTLGRHATPPQYSSFISSLGRSKVAEWYAQDVKILSQLAPL